jgi:hypothetical protein
VTQESDREPTEESDPTGDGDGRVDDERVIEVAGPTLHNTFPNDPFRLDDSEQPTCTLFTNAVSNVTLKVTSVRLTNDTPPNNPRLVLGAHPAKNFFCTRNSPDFADPARKVYPSCVNAELSPDRRSACPLEVRAIGRLGTESTATLRLRMSARCTNLEGQPCAQLSGRAHPSRSHPVTVVWTLTKAYAACLTRGSNGYDEQADRRCNPETFPDQPPYGDSDTTEESAGQEPERHRRVSPAPTDASPES